MLHKTAQSNAKRRKIHSCYVTDISNSVKMDCGQSGRKGSRVLWSEQRREDESVKFPKQGQGGQEVLPVIAVMLGTKR